MELLPFSCLPQNMCWLAWTMANMGLNVEAPPSNCSVGAQFFPNWQLTLTENCFCYKWGDEVLKCEEEQKE